jgi:hypothetical protein
MEHIVCGSSQRPDAVLPAMEGTRHEEEMTVAQFMEDIVLSSRPWIKQPDNKGGLASKLSTLGAHIPLCLCVCLSLHVPCMASSTSSLLDYSRVQAPLSVQHPSCRTRLLTECDFMQLSIGELSRPSRRDATTETLFSDGAMQHLLPLIDTRYGGTSTRPRVILAEIVCENL